MDFSFYPYLKSGSICDSAAAMKFMIWDRIVLNTDWNNLWNAKGDDEKKRSRCG